MTNLDDIEAEESRKQQKQVAEATGQQSTGNTPPASNLQELNNPLQQNNNSASPTPPQEPEAEGGDKKTKTWLWAALLGLVGAALASMFSSGFGVILVGLLLGGALGAAVGHGSMDDFINGAKDTFKQGKQTYRNEVGKSITKEQLRTPQQKEANMTAPERAFENWALDQVPNMDGDDKVKLQGILEKMQNAAGDAQLSKEEVQEFVAGLDNLPAPQQQQLMAKQKLEGFVKQ